MKIGCLHPYIPRKGDISPSGEINEVRLPCGKCPVCRARRRKDWTLRLQIENDFSRNCYFLTLTYNDENINFFNSVPVVVYRDVQLFLKRLRRRFDRTGYKGPKLRFFCAPEYGSTTLRPHYHILLFNVPPCRDLYKLVESCWGKGFVKVNKAKRNHFAYVAKYCSDDVMQYGVELPKEHRPRPRMSSRPGIGSKWLTDSRLRFYHKNLQTFLHYKGFTYAMPRYFKDRIFCDEESRNELRRLAREYHEEQSRQYYRLYGQEDFQRRQLGLPTIYEEAVISFLQELKGKNIAHKNKTIY